MWFNPFAIMLVMNAVRDYQEIIRERKTPTEPEKIPTGYYKCADCGKICKRLNASQKRCTECQKIHRRELNREYDRKRARNKR